MNDTEIEQLIARQKTGFALENAFYEDDEIYRRDIERIYLRSWLYAGHQSEIPGKGDYFVYELAGESVIIVRGNDDQIHAHMNVCRHRGSHVCWNQKGNSRRFTCPYHGWTYELDGQLVAAAHMREGFDKSRYGLKPVYLRVCEGLIFINFADEPGNFEAVERDLGPFLKPYQLDRARVAHKQSYPMNANWKLAVENYKECYHCAPAHPEYSRAHSLALPDERWQEERERLLERMPTCGLNNAEMDHSYTTGDEFGSDRAYEHYPLLRGHVTGSEDGKPVAPLMGDITDWDGGAHDFKIGPVLYALAYCDHVVLYNFKPLSRSRCDCEIIWLVNGDAVEGKDYELDRLTWLWDVTTKADKAIIEHNQAGVSSRTFEPGPFSTFEESTQRWVEWYLRAIA
ncbi:aromatic ring-hydroxylating oxygenase subunit alpha [Elongatibacter sediminis]|uniref:Aromatic ring-hydroxylating dioxygenase subunit alpha n=1 Tax=Elongatibacter sediminis TaxID=3119006 RepID=A0AAW9RJW2_9GAMM